MSIIKSVLPFTGGELRHYRDLALLFLKYGRDDLLTTPGAADHFSAAETETRRGRAEELAGDLEKLGPTFVKIGQLLSTRADLLQKPYLDALARLQDDVAPVPFEEISEAASDDLGVRISKAFAWFDEKPLASASLGQVHRATLRDGRQVVVKVQRPGIRERVMEDMKSIANIAEYLDEHTEMGRRIECGRLVEEFRKTILRELDYTQEARYLHFFHKELRRFYQIIIPEVIPDLSASRVITMTYLEGNPITRLSGIVTTEMDGTALADQLLHAYLYQILVLGSFHADPHPGNVLVTPDHRIALIDLGMVGHVDEVMRETLGHFLIALSEKKGRTAGELAIKMSTRFSDFDRAGFLAEVSRLISDSVGSDVRGLQVGSVVMQVTQLCADKGLRIPEAVVMLGKTLLNLDLIAEKLDPRYDPAAAIRDKASSLLKEQAAEKFSLGTVLATARDVRDLVADLPGKTNRVLELLADNKLRVKIDAVDEHLLVRTMQKIANRITCGLIIAALIVGAALVMRIPTSWRIFGYPPLAFVLFITACLVGGGLVWNILMKDE